MRLDDLPEIGFVFSNRIFGNEREVLGVWIFRNGNPGKTSALPFRGGSRAEYEEGRHIRHVESVWLVSPGWVDQKVLYSGIQVGDAGATDLLATVP